MTRLQKFQKISSIIPFWSTFLVVIITMVELKRHLASKRIWGYFILTFFGAGTLVYLLNKVIMTGQHPFLNVIASGLILAVANILFVDFQIMSMNAKQNNTSSKSNAYVYIIIFSVVAAVCGLGILLSIFFTPTVINDNNGAFDTSLVTINLEQIISSPDNYSSYFSHTSNKGPSSYVTGRMKDYDYQECSFTCREISGIMTLQATKTKSNYLTLEICSQLDKGNMEIVVIVDGEYYDSIPVNQNSRIVLSNIADKTIVVRVAAESAKAKVEIKRKTD